MAITFVDRGTTIHNNDGNSSTVSMPAGVSAGDLFVGIAYLEDEILSGGSASTPVTVNFNADTLSAQERVISGTASGDNSTIYVFAKTLTSTDLVSSVISITNSNFDAEDIIFEHLYFSGDVPTTITDVTKNEFTVNPPQVTSNGNTLTTRIGGGAASDLTISGSDAWNTTHYDHGSVSIHAYHHKNKKFSTFTTTPAITDTNWIIREAAPSISNTSASSLAVYGTDNSGFGTSLELQIVTTTNNNTKRQVGVVFAIPRTISSGTNHPSNNTDTSETSDSLTSTKSVVSTATDTSDTSDSLSAAKSASSTATDTSDTSDSLSVAKSALLTKLDTSETSDTLSVIKSATLTATDTSETSDSLSSVKSAASSNTDTSEVSDALSAVKSVTESNTDTSETSDSLSAVAAKTSGSTDTSSVEDSLSAQKAAVFSETDTSVVSDVLSATKETTESNTDTSSASDTLDIFVSELTANIDTSETSDTLSATKAVTKSSTDTSSVSDTLSVLKSSTESNTDTSSASDALNAFVSELTANTDTSETSDTISATKSSTESNTDTSSVSDTLSAQKSVVFSKTDTSETQDTLSATKESTEELTDTSEASDALSATKSVVLSTTDTSSASDDKSAVVTASVNHPSNEEDTSSAFDALSATKEAQSSNTDSTEVSDTLSVEKSISSEEQDASEVSDSLSTTVQHSAFITDSVSSSDVFSAPAQKEVFITDTSESGDTVFPIKTITVGLLDTVSGSDLVGSQTDREIILTDTVSVLDELLAVGPVTKEIIATIIGNGGIDFNLMKEAQAVATIDVWNVALNALGISTLATTEGNNPQQTLLSNTFSLFRKQFLSDHLWNGAKRTTDLTKLDVNTTDQSVANRWKYVYVLPTDCMRVWRLNGQENKPVHVGGNSNIYTNRWEIEVVTKGTTGGDTNTGRYRALCTNEDEARIEYVFDVINDIDLLGPLTQHAMGLALAAFVATNFGKSASEIAQLEAQAKDAITAAKGVDGQEGTPQIFGDTSLLGVRSIGY